MLFFNGVRAHEILTNPVPVVWGVEIEAAAVALSRGRGFYPLYAASPEVRLYVGMANPQAAHPGFSDTWGPMLGIELTGGYATFW